MIQWMLAIWPLVPLPFLKPAWISGSSQFTYCWSLAWRILSITFLACEMSAIVWYFEHSLALPFFGIGMKTDLFQSCGHCWVFQIGWHIECSTFRASSFRIWNSSTGIPSPPLALFVVMLSKGHLTSHSRMSGSRWVITPSWLSGSWRSFLYSSCVYSCHLFLIFLLLLLSPCHLCYRAHLCMKCSLHISNFLEEISSLSHSVVFLYFFDHWGRLRGWDGWMASPTQWTWVWVIAGSWWCTGRPGVLWFMGLQRVGHDWATELNYLVQCLVHGKCSINMNFCDGNQGYVTCLTRFVTLLVYCD